MRKRLKSDGILTDSNLVLQKLIKNGLFKQSAIVMRHSNIRVMVFAEKSNRLRFDSDTIKLSSEGSGKLIMTKSPCGRLLFAPQKSDTKMIGEYIFGDAEHMLESGSCKFHRNVGGKVLLSRIFGLPREKELGNINFNIECEVRSAVQLWNSYLNHTSALQTTTRSDYFDTEPPEYIRRISKSQKLMSSRIPMRSTDCTVSYGDSYRLGSVVKGLNAIRLIAVAVLFDAEFTDFVIDNIHYIDRELRNLQHKLFEAFCCDKKEFHWNTAIACYNFRGNMISFHNAFRMINYLRESPTMNFFVNLNNLITIFETKEAGYFLSKLISSVLMFHLSWVTTTNEAYNNRLGNFWSRSEIIDNKTKPLLTILGCIGLLSHTTRIVITGKNLEHVGNILGILLYFVRFHRLNISKKQIKNIHFSPNDLWAFTKAEVLARMEQRKNLTNNDDSKKLAEKWQLGEFSAIFSQKFLLRENLTNDPWIVKFNNSLFNFPTMRFRAKSEPQRITNDEDSLSDDNDFRPRSISNPISQFPTQPISKDFEKYCAKDAYPDHNHFTKASGKVPYGFTIPKFADDKIHDDEIDYLQSLFQKYEYNEANHVWGKIKQHNSKRLKLKLMDFDYEDLILTIPLQEERKMFISKPEKIYEAQPCSSKDSNSVNTSQMDKSCSSSSFLTKWRDFETSNTFDTSELHGNNDIPYWKRNRKSSTALARALTNNSAHLLDSLNPDELEEIFENRLNDIHFTENTIDEYVDNFSNDESYSTITDSLYGGINNKFEPAFVIQGIDGNLINLKTLKEIIKKEISQPESFYITIPKDDEKESSKDTNKLKSKSHSDTKEFEFIQMTSVFILADVDNGKISIMSGDLQTLKEEEMTYPCDSILSMMEKIREMKKLGSSAETMTKMMECSLDDLVRQSILLQEFIESLDQNNLSKAPFDPSKNIYNRSHLKLISEISKRHRDQDNVIKIYENSTNEEKIDATTIIKHLDCHYSDLRLLINICSILSPAVRSAILPSF